MYLILQVTQFYTVILQMIAECQYSEHGLLSTTDSLPLSYEDVRGNGELPNA